MKQHATHICSFQSLDRRAGKGTQYADLKREVLKAGRFSVFEATDNEWAAKLFDRLCKDPEIEIVQMGYPWTGVRLRTKGESLAQGSGLAPAAGKNK